MLEYMLPYFLVGCYDVLQAGPRKAMQFDVHAVEQMTCSSQCNHGFGCYSIIDSCQMMWCCSVKVAQVGSNELASNGSWSGR